MSNKFPKSTNKFCNLTTEEAGCIWVGQPPSQPDSLPSSGDCQSEEAGEVMSGDKKNEKAYICIHIMLAQFAPVPSFHLLASAENGYQSSTRTQDNTFLGRVSESQQLYNVEGKPWWSSAPSATSATLPKYDFTSRNLCNLMRMSSLRVQLQAIFWHSPKHRMVCALLIVHMPPSGGHPFLGNLSFFLPDYASPSLRFLLQATPFVCVYTSYHACHIMSQLLTYMLPGVLWTT